MSEILLKSFNPINSPTKGLFLLSIIGSLSVLLYSVCIINGIYYTNSIMGDCSVKIISRTGIVRLLQPAFSRLAWTALAFLLL